jgi:hypothetical protein
MARSNFMQMVEINDFYNAGFGWICRQCERELGPELETGTLSRVFREGESESKAPRLSNNALAKWADPARTTLMCPRCGITEPVDKN